MCSASKKKPFLSPLICRWHRVPFVSVLLQKSIRIHYNLCLSTLMPDEWTDHHKNVTEKNTGLVLFACIWSTAQDLWKGQLLKVKVYELWRDAWCCYHHGDRENDAHEKRRVCGQLSRCIYNLIYLSIYLSICPSARPSAHSSFVVVV